MISSSTRYFLYLNVKRKKEKHEISKEFEWVRSLRMSNAFIMAHNSIILFLRILELLSQNYYPDDTRKRTHNMQYWNVTVRTCVLRSGDLLSNLLGWFVSVQECKTTHFTISYVKSGNYILFNHLYYVYVMYVYVCVFLCVYAYL